MLFLSESSPPATTVHSILDPDMYSVCAAFEAGDKEMDDNVHLANAQIISQAAPLRAW